GESRVQMLQQRVPLIQEFAARRAGLTPARRNEATTSGGGGVRWHMIGHLQRNKVRYVLPLVKLTHSVDSLRLAEEIQAQASRRDVEAEVLLQVNASGEKSKFGVAPSAALHLIEQLETMVHVKVRGLMTMAPFSDNPQDARPTFLRAAELFEEVRARG